MTCTPRASRFAALALAASLALTTLAVTAGCGQKASDQAATQTNGGPPVDNSPMATPAKPGLTGKQKMVLLAGAALLVYLYERDKKQNAAAAAQNAGNAPGGKPQLYREERGPNKGALYYHKNDANHTVVWLSAPSQGVEVPADQVNQYLPNYNSDPRAYQGQVNTSPQAGVNGGTVQPADQYAGASAPGGPPGPGM